MPKISLIKKKKDLLNMLVVVMLTLRVSAWQMCEGVNAASEVLHGAVWNGVSA